MTETHSSHPPAAERHPARQAWAGGLMAFAAVTLLLTGVLDIFRGVMGIAEDDIFVSARQYVFRFDVTGWGWIHLALGAVAVIVGMGLFSGATWARVAGVVIAGLIIVGNFLSLPYYPVWSVVMIAFSAFVIWALCVVRPDRFAD
ncbi:hypothetical protein OG802_05440 [Streptomyces sp. NBC_00704]|uniref:DUF7144 family membrane protein n=1 Tax=Streptomyces sp. NBC_00704 TaxID=2975809 RepID=UPI002E357A13|nr:hypothetical protein [Streptomyces sp. NBC_00704]